MLVHSLLSFSQIGNFSLVRVTYLKAIQDIAMDIVVIVSLCLNASEVADGSSITVNQFSPVILACIYCN